MSKVLTPVLSVDMQYSVTSFVLILVLMGDINIVNYHDHKWLYVIITGLILPLVGLALAFGSKLGF